MNSSSTKLAKHCNLQFSKLPKNYPQDYRKLQVKLTRMAPLCGAIGIEIVILL